ncbi:uncharacterized protein BP01DRAFT_78865 [Aspergillus saccharolyticus JOP 1030-1]|uniref:Uncharacterized protein n=1 Tax=Aspergillus saccharolyticus JOP 1030-1 TaxID=1450539 RepID=A0A318ZQZ6_9EURO|nr:hypothetical protein BP01DRAFT_78865 [Aspergillus saccharolyticus JOP 1030-1]PYH49487.1 hypothetical protein BP01DRAFT_78865 [Aspergillus saccharolyticus JOP 1030-1]
MAVHHSGPTGLGPVATRQSSDSTIHPNDITTVRVQLVSVGVVWLVTSSSPFLPPPKPMKPAATAGLHLGIVAMRSFPLSAEPCRARGVPPPAPFGCGGPPTGKRPPLHPLIGLTGTLTQPPRPSGLITMQFCCLPGQDYCKFFPPSTSICLLVPINPLNFWLGSLTELHVRYNSDTTTTGSFL